MRRGEGGRILRFCGVLAALGVAFWVVTRRFQPVTLEGRKPVTLEPAESADAAVRPPALAAPDVGRDVGSLAGRVEVNAASAPEVARAEDATRIALEVLLPDGSPAAGARVALLDSLRDLHSSQRFVLEPGDPDDAFDLAERGYADELGRADLPSPRGDGRIAAWHGDFYGECRLYPAARGPLRLVLAADPALLVRVVRADGTPLVGIPVVLRTLRSVVATRATQADGLVQLHGRGRREELAQSGAFVQLGVPLQEAVYARVQAGGTTPIVLVAPELGAVEVQLLDGSAEFQGACAVRLGIRDGLRDELPHESRMTSVQEVQARDGRARFAHVGLGLELFAIAEPYGREEAGREFAGPARADAVVACALALGAEGVEMRGVLRGAEGETLGEVLAQLQLRAANGRWSGGQVRTDEGGRFEFAGSSDLLASESLTVRVLAPLGGGHVGTFPLVLAPWRNELGEFFLARAPLLVAGRVMDPSGAPLPGVLIEILQGFTRGAPQSGEQVLENELSDALGRFAIHRPAPEAGGLAVRVRHAGYRYGPEAVAPGTDDLELELQATGSLEFTLLHEGSWSPNVALLQDGRPVPLSTTQSGHGRRFDGLLPGVYDLEWFHPWASERGLVRGLSVVAGETTRDPRLDPLDLRAAWPRVRLTVVDESGVPVAGVRLELWREGAYAGYLLRPEPSELDVIAGPLPLRARLSAAGFRAREFELAADATVVLERGPRLVLVVPTLPALPRDWEWVALLYRPKSPGGLLTPRPLQSGTNEFMLEHAGPHGLRLAARRHHLNWEDQVWRGTEYPLVLGEELTTFTLPPLDADQVEAVRAGIAEKDPFAPR